MDARVQQVELGDFAGPSCLDPAVSLDELAAFGTALPRRDGRLFFDYWLAHWRDGRPPRRADVLPEELGRLLAQVFLIEVEPETGRLRYRLIGTGIAAGIGYDSTGRYLDEVSAGFPEALRARWQRRDALCVGQGRPVCSGWSLDHIGRAWRAVVSLRLPLIEDGRVTHLLGFGAVE
ncbi:PAS domain-containing protein [Tistlia consotensis]|nr:PAS domain-containing protein [Tistlia consotensis]